MRVGEAVPRAQPHLQHGVLHPRVVVRHVLAPVRHQHHAPPPDHKVGVVPHAGQQSTGSLSAACS